MSKKASTDRFKTIEMILSQGMRSRFDKAMNLIDAAEELLPETAMEGNSADIRQAILHLQGAAGHLTEMMAYRKIMGID